MSLVSNLFTSYSRYLVRPLVKFWLGKYDFDLMKILCNDVRIIEVDIKDTKLAKFLLARGLTRYLGLARTSNQQLFKKDHDYLPKIDKYIFPYESPKQIAQNSTDILILSPSLSLRNLWYFNNYKHTLYVLCSPESIFDTLLAIPGLLKNVSLKRIQVVGASILQEEQGINRKFIVIKIIEHKIPNARHYISPVIGIEKFFKYLEKSQVNYTILRWFDDLPEISPGEDIDMLVADENVEVVETFLKDQPGLIPCDIYSVSGLPRTAYKNMAYYPPPLAQKILKGSITFKDYFCVPSPKEHFLSLAYHAIYHKGKSSGIPKSLHDDIPLTYEPEHDYTGILGSLAKSLGINVEITLEALDAYLASEGWQPPRDTLARLDSKELWLQQSQLSNGAQHKEENFDGLVVFFIRQNALKFEFQDRIVNSLSRGGFNILVEKRLNSQEIERVKNRVRGGNWGRGPWSQSGGNPVIVVVAYDLLPIPPSPVHKANQPNLSNARILFKNKIRNELNNMLPSSEKCNFLHSSDNEQEAWDYLQIAMPDEIDQIKDKITKLRASFITTQPVKQQLSNLGRRSKIELIEYQGSLAVKKTFRPTCERFLKREIFVMEKFSKIRSEIPPLLEYGSNFIIFPYYENILRFKRRQSRLLPLQVAKQAIETLCFFYELGYSLIDFHPANLIVDSKTGLKLTDFEFLYKYKTQPESFEKCYDIAGIPDDFDGDKPLDLAIICYSKMWKPYIGLSLTSLLHDPVWLQHTKRLRYAILNLPIRFIKNNIILNIKNSIKNNIPLRIKTFLKIWLH